MSEKYRLFWEQYNKFLRESPDSPLSEKQKQNFIPAIIYDYDEKYRFVVKLKPKKIKNKRSVMGPTGKVIEVKKVGTVDFLLNKRLNHLVVYYWPEKDLHFIHFRDLTSGKETYGAGRFVNLEPTGNEDEFILDFNLAYNPYCVYNIKWTCPTAPLENSLLVPIEAGEKIYPHDEET